MTTIKEVREALDELARRQQSDTNIAAAMYTSGLIHRLDSMVLVPREPTDDQILAGCEVWGPGGKYDDEVKGNIANEYRAMLNAAEDK